MKLVALFVNFNFSLACEDPGWVSGIQRSPGIEKQFWEEGDKVVYACEPPSFGHNGGYTQEMLLTVYFLHSFEGRTGLGNLCRIPESGSERKEKGFSDPDTGFLQILQV